MVEQQSGLIRINGQGRQRTTHLADNINNKYNFNDL